jgi:hypothetical protein
LKILQQPVNNRLFGAEISHPRLEVELLTLKNRPPISLLPQALARTTVPTTVVYRIHEREQATTINFHPSTSTIRNPHNTTPSATTTTDTNDARTTQNTTILGQQSTLQLLYERRVALVVPG